MGIVIEREGDRGMTGLLAVGLGSCSGKERERHERMAQVVKVNAGRQSRFHLL